MYMVVGSMLGTFYTLDMCDATLTGYGGQEMIRGGFLIRRTSAIRRLFAGFLRYDSRMITQEIARKFPGNFVRLLLQISCEFAKHFWRNNFIIVRLSHLRNPAKSSENLRIAKVRLMRNPVLIYTAVKHQLLNVGRPRHLVACIGG